MDMRHRSPYSPEIGPFKISLLHPMLETVVSGLEYGPAGAPFPERRVVVGQETGYADRGVFIVEPTYPRKVHSSMINVVVPPATPGDAEKTYHAKTAFEIGTLGAAFPERVVVVFRWDVMEVGHVDDRYHRFTSVYQMECEPNFGGLGATGDLSEDGAGTVSPAAWRAMKHVLGVASALV